MSPKRLVLFDIDGTILRGGPLWKEAFLSALSQYFPDMHIPTVPFCGKTDIQIVREMMSAAGFTPNKVEESMLKVIDRYVTLASEKVQTRAHEVKVLPGVVEVLEQLAGHSDVLLGLLTGNVRRGADTKLQSVGLHHHFKMGVYGDDNPDRYQLPPIAVARARELFGHSFSGKQIVIIGDTVHDVNCGKSIGVRSIAVGTGFNIPTEELLAQNPDYYFTDLSAVDDVVAAILEDL